MGYIKTHNEWQPVTTSENKRQPVTSDNQWQPPITTSNNVSKEKWQRVTTSKPYSYFLFLIRLFSLVVTRCRLSSSVVTGFHSLSPFSLVVTGFHRLSLIVAGCLVVTGCRLFSLGVTGCRLFSLIVTGCHWLSGCYWCRLFSLVVTRCCLFSLVVTGFHWFCHSLSLVVCFSITLPPQKNPFTFRR